jgi:hypothetical protein
MQQRPIQSAAKRLSKIQRTNNANDWRDVAGRFADASPAVKNALERMRNARHEE